MLEVSAGIVISDSRVLCFRKGISKYPYLSHKYEFPGGKIENGESPEEALIREFREELSAEISSQDIQPLGLFTYSYPDFSVNLHAFVINTNDFRFILSEHESCIWSSAEKLDQFDWAAADRDIVKSLKQVLK